MKLNSYPIKINGIEHRAYLAKEVDILLMRKDSYIENLEARLRVRELATPRTRSG